MKKYLTLCKRAINPKNWRDIYNEYRELTMYFFVGVATTAVSFAVYYIFRALLLHFMNSEKTTVPVVASWIFSVTFAYIMNRVFVFRSTARGKIRILKEVFLFFAMRIITLLSDIFIMYLLVDLTNMHNAVYEFFVKCASNIIVLVLNYIFGKKIVFRDKSKEV
ncbi:membrane protein, GtrA family [Clostridia bacterium]|nr:membrane protein, GtrA family [Clostridia bacterium]